MAVLRGKTAFSEGARPGGFEPPIYGLETTHRKHFANEISSQKREQKPSRGELNERRDDVIDVISHYPLFLLFHPVMDGKGRTRTGVFIGDNRGSRLSRLSRHKTELND